MIRETSLTTFKPIDDEYDDEFNSKPKNDNNSSRRVLSPSSSSSTSSLMSMSSLSSDQRGSTASTTTTTTAKITTTGFDTTSRRNVMPTQRSFTQIRTSGFFSGLSRTLSNSENANSSGKLSGAIPENGRLSILSFSTQLV